MLDKTHAASFQSFQCLCWWLSSDEARASFFCWFVWFFYPSPQKPVITAPQIICPFCLFYSFPAHMTFLQAFLSPSQVWESILWISSYARKSQKHLETPLGIQNFYHIFWSRSLMAFLKERYHVRVWIKTHHHFIQQGILSFIAGRTHNGLAFRTELEQAQLEQSVLFQPSAIGKKDHLASERSCQWLKDIEGYSLCRQEP